MILIKGECYRMKLVKIQEYDIGQKIEIFQSPETKGLYFDTGNTGKVIPLRPNDVAVISSSINTEMMLTNGRAKASEEAYKERLALLAKYQETIAALKLVVNKMYNQGPREGEEVEREVLWENVAKAESAKSGEDIKVESGTVDLTGGKIKDCSLNTSSVPTRQTHVVRESVIAGKINPIKF